MLKQLRSKNVISYGHFVYDVLVVLSKLSQELQKKDASIYVCHEMLTTTKISLQKLEERYLFNLTQMFNVYVTNSCQLLIASGFNTES